MECEKTLKKKILQKVFIFLDIKAYGWKKITLYTYIIIKI